MAEATPSTVAVTLSVARMLEERVIDWLLARPDVATFTSTAVHAYGADSGGLSTAEQVAGRQRRVELTIELPGSAAETWLDDLAAAFAAMDVEYRVTPVLISGRLLRPLSKQGGDEATSGAVGDGDPVVARDDPARRC